MKVAIFFDGQNFYRSLLRYDESLRVDYDRLATWITQQAGGANALFSGAYYYVGVSPDAPPLVEGFLKGRSEEHTSELQSQAISYAGFCFQKKNNNRRHQSKRCLSSEKPKHPL